MAFVLKTFFSLTICLCALILESQGQQSYYDGIDFELDSIQLKDELSTLIISTHVDYISYATAYQTLKETDQEPGDTNLVRLVYGSDDSDELLINDLTRDKNMTGGTIGSWNREHVYPKSLATPALTNSGPGADVHMLRSCDLQMNSTRSNRKFIEGSGTANYDNTGWYPGDEWKGDCARIIMYAYLHYGTRCLPINVGIGEVNNIDADMLNLFLTWNAQDEVSPYEQQRNAILENIQGNRNPFIDNPALATKIWGGLEATDTWGILYTNELTLELNAFFEGPYNSETQMMNDLLRAGNHIPNEEPYSALGFDCQTTIISSTILDVTGENAVMDWVLVELRDANDPSVILESKPALIQRDGDIISGVENVSFIIEHEGIDDFVVAIRHRNHFGVRTLQSFNSNETIIINFSDPALSVSGIDTRIIADGKALLISGDANGDGVINTIDKNNFWCNHNGQVFDYMTYRSDFNLDGVVNVVDKNNVWRANNSKIEFVE